MENKITIVEKKQIVYKLTDTETQFTTKDRSWITIELPCHLISDNSCLLQLHPSDRSFARHDWDLMLQIHKASRKALLTTRKHAASDNSKHGQD